VLFHGEGKSNVQQTLFVNQNQTLLEMKQVQINQGITGEEFEQLLNDFCEKYSLEKKVVLEIIAKEFSQKK